jgi:hypothetical protein
MLAAFATTAPSREPFALPPASLLRRFVLNDKGQELCLPSLIGFWSIRLGSHLIRRMIGKPEDERYQRLREPDCAEAAEAMSIRLPLPNLLDDRRMNHCAQMSQTSKTWPRRPR